jgi:hypothetical protein
VCTTVRNHHDITLQIVHVAMPPTPVHSAAAAAPWKPFNYCHVQP